MSEDIRMWRDLAASPSERLGEPCPRRNTQSACGGSPLWDAIYEAAKAPVDLYRMLEESGGAWFGEPKGNYSHNVARMESDLRHRYVPAIHPDTTRRGRHELRVETNRPEWRVRARKAYVRE